MKRYILILLVPFFFGCEKKYTCEIITEGLSQPYYYEFKGTHKEMKEFEQSGSPTQTINCK